MKLGLKVWVGIAIGVVLLACDGVESPVSLPGTLHPYPTLEQLASPTATPGSVFMNLPTSTRRPTLTLESDALPSETPVIVTLSSTATPISPASPSLTKTPTPFPTATESPTATKLPVSAGPVVVYETTLTIQTYGYQDAFQSTDPGDAIYPYPRLDAGQVTPPQPRAYKVVVMENDNVLIYVLPELGGRIYRWVDKISGRRLLYENPVIKPTQWGYRGWWLAAGGIEWAFPVEEHGLNEWRPWTYNISNTGSTASVTVSDTEDQTGMEVGVTISLDSASSILKLQPWVRNNTAADHNYQLWVNAMLALNENKCSKNTEFIFPASQVIVHSTGDNRFPGEWQWMSWPEYNGINVSLYSTWQGWLGFFVPNVSAGFAAVYDHDAEQGVVRIFTPGWPAGTKIFGPGTLPSWLWTDDDSNYVEFWSGATATFADYTVLKAGESVSWVEYWFPVHNLGGVSTATKRGVLSLTVDGNRLNVGAMATQEDARTLVLWQNSTPVQTWTLSLSPGQTFNATWSNGENVSLGLSLLDADGNVMVQTGLVD